MKRDFNYLTIYKLSCAFCRQTLSGTATRTKDLVGVFLLHLSIYQGHFYLAAMSRKNITGLFWQTLKHASGTQKVRAKMTSLDAIFFWGGTSWAPAAPALSLDSLASRVRFW